MRINALKLSGAAVIEAEPHVDSRGKFARLFCQKELGSLHNNESIDQINHSVTVEKGSMRGLHFQHPPHAEIKMVRCIKGSVFDVMVDLRENSPTFMQWHGEVLSQDNLRMIYIPKGFAHGFQSLEGNCELLYLHSGFYEPKTESGIRYNDPTIGIEWPREISVISERDKCLPLLTAEFKGLIV
jgi:dTDP-4-dehydrorhamnose 3,5-epimerase